MATSPEDRVRELEALLVQQRAWIRHWKLDLDCKLPPTTGSLEEAGAAIDAALAIDRPLSRYALAHA